jgi:hypothetical protein
LLLSGCKSKARTALSAGITNLQYEMLKPKWYKNRLKKELDNSIKKLR